MNEILNIPVKVTRYENEEGKWASDHRLSLAGTYHRFGVGFVDKTTTCRRSHHGPELPGPYAYTYGLSSVISANPEMSTGAEIKRNLAAGLEHEVKDGDLLRIGDDVFKVRVVRREWIELDLQGSFQFTATEDNA